MKSVICPYCGFGCRLQVDPETLTVIPDKTSPVNGGRICPKGLKANEFVVHRDRLKRPLKAVDRKFIPVSWSRLLGKSLTSFWRSKSCMDQMLLHL